MDTQKVQKPIIEKIESGPQSTFFLPTFDGQHFRSHGFSNTFQKA